MTRAAAQSLEDATGPTFGESVSAIADVEDVQGWRSQLVLVLQSRFANV